jgi:hypothetical protein
LKSLPLAIVFPELCQSRRLVSHREHPRLPVDAATALAMYAFVGERRRGRGLAAHFYDAFFLLNIRIYANVIGHQSQNIRCIM